MDHDRRDLLRFSTAAMAATVVPSAAQEPKAKFGLIGQMVATPGKRDELVGYLANVVGAMPGCLSYVVALDLANSDAIWITEVWESRESHSASLKLPVVRAAIAKARPIIAGFPQHFRSCPGGGDLKSRLRRAYDQSCCLIRS